ncbi:Hypothetical protein LLA12_02184 [Lactococcus lactis subsp. lactis]|nr:Hypothetical protein LLA12_02184 [Lactococcus lactis subsp. lactis]
MKQTQKILDRTFGISFLYKFDIYNKNQIDI